MSGDIMMEDDAGYSYDTIREGKVIDVPNSDKAGLLATTTLYVRRDVIRLWRALDASSCIVRGLLKLENQPLSGPGSCKSQSTTSGQQSLVVSFPSGRSSNLRHH